MLSPEMLEGERPLFEEDEAAGTQREIKREELKKLVFVNAQLLALFRDMDSGLIRLTLSEYNEMSWRLMSAWDLFNETKYQKHKTLKAEHDKQRN